MTFRVRCTPEAVDDLIRLYEFVLNRDSGDFNLAERALQAIREGVRTLASSPFSCRRAKNGDPFLRELIISFGAAGYVALFEIENSNTVTILAVRHQRESDYL